MPLVDTSSNQISFKRILKIIFIILVFLVFILWLFLDQGALRILVSNNVYHNPNVGSIKIWGLITPPLNAVVFWSLFKLVKVGRIKDVVAFFIVLILVLIELYLYAMFAIN